MNVFESTILCGIARTINHWRTLTIRFPNESRDDHDRWHTETELQRLANERTTPIDLAAFLGDEPTASDRTRATRAYASLEASGLLERLAARHSTRTAAVRLTDAGQQFVDSLSSLRDSQPLTVPYAGTAEPAPEGSLKPGPGEGSPEVLDG